jgi:aarF domain-containing kinase
MQLTMKELFEFKYMQTDPNPANFFYNSENKQLNLIDFGAARSFSDKFIDNYIQVIYHSTLKNKEEIIKYSINLGFLTGEENRTMMGKNH